MNPTPIHPSRRQFLRQAAGYTASASGLVPGLIAPAYSAGETVPVIDCHAHAGTAQQLLNPWTTIGDPEELLRNMEKAGIDKSVIFPMSHSNRHQLFKEGNEEIAAICSRYPDKFIGYAKHNSETEKGRIREMLFREVQELGLRGYKCHHPAPTQEVMEAVAELKIPMIYHPRAISHFVELAEAYPQVDMVLAHLGVPYSRKEQFHIDAILAAKRLPNVYLDTSTVMVTRYLEQALREAGPDKLCFGSDAPDCDSRLEIFKIRNAMATVNTPADKQAMVLGGNLLNLLTKSGRAIGR